MAMMRSSHVWPHQWHDVRDTRVSFTKLDHSHHTPNTSYAEVKHDDSSHHGIMRRQSKSTLAGNWFAWRNKEQNTGTKKATKENPLLEHHVSAVDSVVLHTASGLTVLKWTTGEVRCHVALAPQVLHADLTMDGGLDHVRVVGEVGAPPLGTQVPPPSSDGDQDHGPGSHREMMRERTRGRMVGTAVARVPVGTLANRCWVYATANGWTEDKYHDHDDDHDDDDDDGGGGFDDGRADVEGWGREVPLFDGPACRSPRQARASGRTGAGGRGGAGDGDRSRVAGAAAMYHDLPVTFAPPILLSLTAHAAQSAGLDIRHLRHWAPTSTLSADQTPRIRSKQTKETLAPTPGSSTSTRHDRARSRSRAHSSPDAGSVRSQAHEAGRAAAGAATASPDLTIARLVITLNSRGEVAAFTEHGRRLWIVPTRAWWANPHGTPDSHVVVPTLKAIKLRVGGPHATEAILVAGLAHSVLLAPHGGVLAAWALPQPPTAPLVVGDVDGDGRMDVMLSAADGAVFGWSQRITPGLLVGRMLVAGLGLLMLVAHANHQDGNPGRSGGPRANVGTGGTKKAY